jgi:sulfite reductase (NADPH) hemoprotein beta-component
MYEYSPFDKAFLKARNAQFRAQIARRLNGELSEDAFKPLRLLNGLYYQLHAYMLRVAIPYGTLNSQQMRMLAHISEKWDRGFGHFTTRQNIQFNWPELSDVPDMLDALETVGMHSVQTSGNTIRNVTADHFAGAAADEIEDPRPIAELLRQWSTDHAEFQFLPRKFKIAVTGSVADRAVIRAHDIGLRIVENAQGERGFEVIIGGGLGRTPMIGKQLKSFLPKADLLPYLEAVVATYNLLGRRDNKYKARIKITVHEHGIDKIRALVEQKFAQIRPDYPPLGPQILTDIQAHFTSPEFKRSNTERFVLNRSADPVFRAWCDTNLHPHKQADHAIVTISLKPHGGTPGDATAVQMRLIADLAKRYSHDEIRISHEQNIILPHVQKNHLPQLHAALVSEGLATANIGLTSDIIACPGMDFCALATAHSIPVARQISNRIQDLKIEHDVGPLKIKISGCINACGHHHLGHIGILGLERAGVENYQITLGGDATADTRIGTRTGPGFAADKIVPAIERLILGYLDLRNAADESFIQCYRRIGTAPFKEILYPQEVAKNAA